MLYLYRFKGKCFIYEKKLPWITLTNPDSRWPVLFSTQTDVKWMKTMNNVLKVTLRCIGAYCIGVEHRLTLNQTLAGDRKHHRRGTKADVGGRFTLLVSCLCVRLCTTTPAEAEPASGTASFASNTWRPGTTSQRRWVCPSFGSVSASWLQLTLQHVQKVARTPDHFVWVTEAQLKGIYGMCCRWQCSHWYGHIAHLRLLSSLDLGDGGGGW